MKQIKNWDEALEVMNQLQKEVDSLVNWGLAHTPPIPYSRKLKSTGHPVYVIYDGVTYRYPSIREAARYNNVSESAIRKGLKKKPQYVINGRIFYYPKLKDQETMTLP